MQPSRPAASIDAMFLHAAIGGTSGPDGEVWFASTDHSGQRYGHLFVADLKQDWVVTPLHLGYPEGAEFWVFEANATEKVRRFSESIPLRLSVCLKFLIFRFTFGRNCPAF